MIPKSLSITERTLLANQFRILAKLDKDNDNSSYISRAEILEKGLESEYGRVFSDVEVDVVEEETSKEVMDILDMFWIIQSAVKQLSDVEKSQLDIETLSFRGFDGNNDFHQRRYIRWWVNNNQGTYSDLGNVDITSHSILTIGDYRAMLNLYKSFSREGGQLLTFDQLQQLQDSKTLYA